MARHSNGDSEDDLGFTAETGIGEKESDGGDGDDGGGNFFSFNPASLILFSLVCFLQDAAPDLWNCREKPR